MKALELSEKLGYINDDLIEKAAAIGGLVKRRRAVKRIVVAALIAAIVLIGTFSTAMAVSEDFRAAVIAFFKLSTPETVAPDVTKMSSGDITVYSSSSIDGLVDINYLKIDGDYEYNDGVVYVWHGDNDYANGTYYCVVDNTLVPLHTERIETSFTCRGYTWDVRFDYAVVDGIPYIHNIPDSRMPELEEGENLYAYASTLKNGDTEKVLLTLPFPHSNARSYSEYLVELDIATDTVTDFLSQCDFENMPYLIENIAISDNLSKAIVTCYSEDYNGYATTYYCDVTVGKLVPISDITGLEATDNYTLLDNETLFYTTDNTDGWRLNLQTDEKYQVYSGLKAYTDADGGVQFLGGKYALVINTDRSVRLMNLATGTQSLIDGFQFTVQTGAYLNADQSKIYFICYNDNLEIGNLGLLDISAAKMILLDREGQEIRREWNPDWFDNNRIAVSARDDSKNQYLYLYEFN